MCMKKINTLVCSTDPLSNEKNKALEPALEIMFHIPLQNYQDE